MVFLKSQGQGIQVARTLRVGHPDRFREARRDFGTDTGIMRTDRGHPQACRILAQRVRIGPEIVDRDQRTLLPALEMQRGFRRVGHPRLHAVRVLV